MKVEGEYTFDAPQDLVWEAVQDPDVLGSILPGGEGVEQVGENEYKSKLKIKVGPVQGKFTGNIKLSDIVPPDSYNIEVDGKGAPGFVKANGSLKLSSQSDTTLLTYAGEARVGGKIASVGQRLIDTSAKSIIRQSLEALNAYLQVQMAKQEAVKQAEAAGASEEQVAEAVEQVKAPEYVPPSQMELATNVAKDVAGDLIPPKYRPVVIAIVVLVIVALLYWIIF